ncbi:MAG: SatD family protein [Verrucomicrobiota bacterium]
MKYLVLIGDIVGSRGLSARAQFQRRMKGVLQALNGRRKTLASPYTLTLGDEFQAVYRDADAAFADVFAVLAEIAPVQARFALAVGEIVTPVNPTQAIGMDGPAFHRARALLEQLKAGRRLLGVDGGAGGWTLPAAALAVLSGQLAGWRENRLKLFARILAGEPAGELAKRTGITPRAVNKNIRAADLDEWKRILDEITRLLNEELKSR